MAKKHCAMSHRRYGEQKNCAISHPLLNEGAFIREYSTIRLLFNRHWNDLKDMCPIDLIVEYSRMNVPSLSSGCEIAQFFVRYMAHRRLYERPFIREYSTIGPNYNRNWNDLQEMCQWPDCWVLTYERSFVKSSVRHRAICFARC
jgi:hypothetical protein